MLIRILLLTCLAAAAPAVGADAPGADAPSVDAPSTPPVMAAAPPRGEGSPGQAVVEDPYEGAAEVFRFGFEPDEDRDYDRQPDGWLRRKGPDFPSYIEAAIDRDRGHGGSRSSLRFDANGGRVTMYSLPIVIDPYHSYIFRGYVRTQQLDNDAALISISLLNHKRERVQRFLTRPVTGTFKDWCELTIGPIVPNEDVHFVVVGCHLIPGARMGIRGSAWFDDLWMGELPLFSLETNFQRHFREHDSDVIVTAHAQGLNPKSTHRLDMRMFDAEGNLVAATSVAVGRKPAKELQGPQRKDPAHKPGEASGAPGDVSFPTTQSGPVSAARPPAAEKPILWNLGPQPHGFYAVEAVLTRDGKPITIKRTSFAVMDSLSDVAKEGEFGWTVKRPDSMTALTEFAEIAAQGGINWLKYPLWRSVSDPSSNTSSQLAAFFDELVQRRIKPVGLLNDPPAELRNQFARNWTGISEIFTMRAEFWRESIEKVIARYSAQVRYWQLGEEDDESFVGMSNQNLAQTIARLKTEFDRIGRDTRIGVHWNWETPPPLRRDVPGIFLSLSSRHRLTDTELAAKLNSTASGAPERWVLISPLPKTGFTVRERASDLVKRIVAAKIAGADKIVAEDVFDEELGLLSPGGTPSVLFLPWWTTALALRGAENIGSFVLPERSRNYVFARSGEAAIVVWNDEPVLEDLALDDEALVTDVLGRQIRRAANSSDGAFGQSSPPGKLRVGPSPLVIRHFSEPVARWMTGISFEKGRLPSKTGKQKEAIRGVNTFRQPVGGSLRITVPKDWKVDPPEQRFSLQPGEEFAWPIALELPSNTSQGRQQLILDFAMANRTIRVYRDYEVGLGDVILSVTDAMLPNGDLQIKQTIDNRTDERLSFQCDLYVPGHKRMQRTVNRLMHNRDTVVYVVPGGGALKGTELQLRAKQIGGQRVLNSRWKVGDTWDDKKKAAVNRHKDAVRE